MVIISVIDYTLMSNPHVKSYANPPLPQFFFVVSLFWYNVTEDETVSNLKKENKWLLIDWVDKAISASYILYATKVL